jgi:hypothetical protein
VALSLVAAAHAFEPFTGEIVVESDRSPDGAAARLPLRRRSGT